MTNELVGGFTTAVADFVNEAESGLLAVAIDTEPHELGKARKRRVNQGRIFPVHPIGVYVIDLEGRPTAIPKVMCFEVYIEDDAFKIVACFQQVASRVTKNPCLELLKPVQVIADIKPYKSLQKLDEFRVILIEHDPRVVLFVDLYQGDLQEAMAWVLGVSVGYFRCAAASSGKIRPAHRTTSSGESRGIGPPPFHGSHQTHQGARRSPLGLVLPDEDAEAP